MRFKCGNCNEDMLVSGIKESVVTCSKCGSKNSIEEASVQANDRGFTFTVGDDLTCTDGSKITIDKVQFIYNGFSPELSVKYFYSFEHKGKTGSDTCNGHDLLNMLQGK